MNLAVIALAAVKVVTGPTAIIDGDAKAAGDITVSNEKLAFALAVESPVPYGVPRGAIVDVAPVRAGKIGRDRTVFADFIPNNWSAWPNTYHRVEIVEHGPERAIIRAIRDWGKVTITTTYSLAAGADRVEIETTMRNEGATALPDLLSGLTLWPHGGFMFPVPGLAGVTQGSAAGALSDRFVTYDADWTITLHAPYLDHVGDGSRDLYLLHTLGPGQTQVFRGWLQVGSEGDLTPVVRAEIERKNLPSGTVRGIVTSEDGKAVATPAVVVEKQGKPYAWMLGHDGRYELQLPAGDYSLYATAAGYSQSKSIALTVAAQSQKSIDFHDIAPPGRVKFTVTDTRGAPLDARIAIAEGQKPLVEFLGRKTFFTELEAKGHADLPLAPGHYVFRVSSGGGFLAPSQDVSLTVRLGSTQQLDVKVRRLFDPRSRGWFAADLHHHADQAEAVTPAADLARSQLAAGLDLLFVSDHDSTVNHAPLGAIAARRGIPFIASLEISPSWGHFNAYPLNPGQKLAIDTSTATIDQVFQEARRQGALVVQVNHPFIPYGYLASVAAGVAPGGYNPGFDLLEINATVPEDDPKVLHELWRLWNEGKHYYLSGGTDTHDVWNEDSGRLRVFAHVNGPLTAQTYAAALRNGHAYVSSGPLVFPAALFGSEVKASAARNLTLAFELQSVAGLRRADLIGDGTVVESRVFAHPLQCTNALFTLSGAKAHWYALTVEDQQGHRAYTDPIWIAASP